MPGNKSRTHREAVHEEETRRRFSPSDLQEPAWSSLTSLSHHSPSPYHCSPSTPTQQVQRSCLASKSLHLLFPQSEKTPSRHPVSPSHSFRYLLKCHLLRRPFLTTPFKIYPLPCFRFLIILHTNHFLFPGSPH